MATQRITVAVLAGGAGRVVRELFRSWRAMDSSCDSIDQFCSALRAHGAELPVIYYCEWVDRWLMGDVAPGPHQIDGRKYQLACYSRPQALDRAKQCSRNVAEEQWFATQLRQASRCWPVEEHGVMLAVREVIGSTALDEEVVSTLNDIPAWLRQWD